MSRYTGRTARLIFMCVVSAFLFVGEMAVGYIGNSLSLSSDGFAVLSHLISMVVGLVGVRYSRVRWHKSNTYGFPRADVVGAFGNAVFAAALMFSILIEAIKRFIGPEKTENALLVLIAGIVGLAINILNYVIFMDCCFPTTPAIREDPETGDTLSIQDEPEDEKLKKDENKGATLNMKGVLLHVLGDALGSVVVVVAATIFYCLPLKKDDPCNWQCYIDPSLTILMVVIILFSAYPLIKESAMILLQMVPKGVDVEEIGQKLAQVPGVKSIHEVHIWELASGKNIATLHVKFKDSSEYNAANHQIRKIFHAEGIHAVTLQVEFTDKKDTGSLSCSSPCISKKCDPQLCCSQLALFDEANGHGMKNGTSSQVWYRSKDLNTTTDIKISIEPLWGEQIESKGRNITNGLTESQAFNSKSTRF